MNRVTILIVLSISFLLSSELNAQWWKWGYGAKKPNPNSNTLYVRDGALGNGSGSDWTNAYDDLPATLIRGYTYYIADGSYAAYNFNDGTSSNKTITIKKATIASHGTSTGWMNSYGDGAAAWEPIIFSTSYWIFDGATGGGPSSWSTGFGFTFSNVACTHAQFISTADLLTNIIIRHTSFVQTGDTEVCIDPVYNVTHAIFTSNDSGTINNSTFEYLYFNNLGGLPFFTREGNNNIIQYTYSGNICGMFVSDPVAHCEWLVIWGMDNTQIRYNYIGESPSSGGIVSNSGTSTANKVYGNVIRNGVPIQCNASCSGWGIFNNTFVTGITSGPLSGSGSCTTCLFYNNIIYSASFVQDESALSTHDYNYYSLITLTQCAMNPGAHENIVNMGCDLVTETNDPFVDSSGTDPTDLKLSGDITDNPGTNICMLDSCTGEDKFNIDAFGVTRTTWDRGAYEFVP